MLKKRPLFTGALLLAFLIWILTGVFGFDPYPKKAVSDRKGTLTGEVLKIEEKSERIYLVLKDAGYSRGLDSASGRNASVSFAGNERETTEGENPAGSVTFRKVLLVLKKDAYETEMLRIGNRISAEASCCGFSSARNPGNFDEAVYYRSLGTEEKFELKGSLTVTDERVRVLRDFLDRFRKRIVSSIRDVADERTAGVFEAIVTGEKSGLSQDTKDRFQKSGIAHILAISGLHISLLGMALLSLLRRRLPILPAAVFSGLFMMCFCIMSGESASAVRATIMFLLHLLALLNGKRFDLLSALSLSGILLLLSNPLYLYHSGFQLSFGAILGIALLVPAFETLFGGGRSPVNQGEGLFADSAGTGTDYGTGMKQETAFPLESSVAGTELEKERIRNLIIGQMCEDGPVRRLFRKFRPAFFASLSVTLFTIPIIINSYYQIPLFSLLLNLLVVPLMSFVLQGGMAGALAGLISLFCGRLLIGLSVYLLNLIDYLCILLDRIPFAVVICGNMSPIRCLLYYGVLLLFIWLASSRFVCFQTRSSHISSTQRGTGKEVDSSRSIASRKSASRVPSGSASGPASQQRDFPSSRVPSGPESQQRRFPASHAASPFRRILAIVLGVLLVLLVFVRPPRTDLSLTFFDVDQGDCILIESPSGLNYMIDGGSSSVSDVFRYRLQSALKYRGISFIDYVIITHPDQDHISGILSLLEEEGAGSISVGDILIPSVEENENYEELMQKAEAAGVSVTALHSGMCVSDSRLRFQCLHPDSDYRPGDANGYSAVMELTYGDFRALFTGDISETEERILLDKGRLSSCSLLKVAHHGSRFSSTTEFLKAVQPKVAVVSAGVDNRYGHPHPDVLARLQSAGTAIYTTPENGAITVKATEDGTYEAEGTLSSS